MSDSKAPVPPTKAKTFKPRAGIVRKSKAERDAHAKEEAEKAAARAAAAAQASEQPAQSSRQSATKKKREPPRDNKDNSQGAGRGVFGAVTGARPGWKRSVTDTGYSERLDGQEAQKPSEAPKLKGQDNGLGDRTKGTAGSASGPNRATKAARDAATIESDNEPIERSRDIERIWISSDEEEDQQQAATEDPDIEKSKTRALSEGRGGRFGVGLRPVRAIRATVDEHETEVRRRADKKVVKSNRTVADDGDEHEDDNDMEIDNEPVASQPLAKQDVPSSPELSRRGKPGRKLGSRTKDSKLATETMEEKAERLRLLNDIEKLKEDFLLAPKVKRDMDLEQDENGLKPDGKLFLFQFPPLVPFLANESTLSGTNVDGRPQISEFEPAIKHENDISNSIQSANGGESSHSGAVLSKTQTEGMFTATEPLRLPPGRVGKLRIHKSGKVTMDWGGTDMEVRYGTEVDFLQDAVLVEMPPELDEARNKGSNSQTGNTYALGQIQNKMIVIPDWQKLYD